MKALAIDSASSALTIAAKNDIDTITLTLDIGMRQSEKILPAIDYLLAEAGLQAGELDYIALSKGPGTFTGLRLAFSAAKAISLAYGTPIYVVDTLEAYAHPFTSFPQKVISVLDAKKGQFFAAVYHKGEELMKVTDLLEDTLGGAFDCIAQGEQVIAAGANADAFVAQLAEKRPDITAAALAAPLPATATLFALAEEQIAKKMPPLQDYEGPAYMRKSEAEIALEKSKAQAK